MKERTVLIVEGDRTLSGVLKYNLTREGYRAVNAFDGAQALELARRDKPDLIVLDVMLPQMSGLEVCRILRKEMTVPILMLSARGEGARFVCFRINGLHPNLKITLLRKHYISINDRAAAAS